MSWKILEKISKKKTIVIDVSINQPTDVFDIKIKKISKVTIKTKNNE